MLKLGNLIHCNYIIFRAEYYKNKVLLGIRLESGADLSLL